MNHKKLAFTLLFAGSLIGGASALTPGEYQERLARKSLFDTIIASVDTIISAPVIYIKRIMAIPDLPQETKDHYAKTTSGYVATFNKILGIGKSKIDAARADLDKELAGYAKK